MGTPEMGTSVAASRRLEREKLGSNSNMATFVLWLILLILCWPAALLALVLYPFVWLLLLPFRLVGVVVGGVLVGIWSLVTLPARLLRGPSRIRHA